MLCGTLSRMLLRVTASAMNDRGPLYMEQVLAALHQAAGAESYPLTLSLGRHGATVGLTCSLPDEHANVFSSQLLAHYPTARVDAAQDEEPAPDSCTWTAALTLDPQLFPIKRFVQFADGTTPIAADPLTGILAALAGTEHDPLRTRIDLVIRAASPDRVKRARYALKQLSRTKFIAKRKLASRFVRWSMSSRWHRRFLARVLARRAGPRQIESGAHVPASRSHDRETAHQAAADKLSRQLFDVHLRLSVEGPLKQEQRARKKLRTAAGAFGPLALPHLGAWALIPMKMRRTKVQTRPEPFLLSVEEIATIWHLPTISIQAPTLEIAPWCELEPPPILPDPRSTRNIVTLGRTAFRERRSLFGISAEDRHRHLYIVGKTGMGKTSLLHSMIASDIGADRGCCLIDPHGDLSEAVLASAPSKRTNDIVLFDAGDRDQPVSFNPLAGCDPLARSLVASGLLTAFKKLYGDSWGPRLEHIFRNCLLALLEIPGMSLVSLVQLLGDAPFRERVISRVSDPVVRSFWQNEFYRMPAKLQAEAIAPIQNKVGQFVSSPILRHILGQARSTIDLRRIMDNGQVLIINLSKGRIGEDASTLLGSLLVSAVQLAAMSRAELPEQDRREFFFYVDEFQNFATESFATILAEARKYRLCLTLANQYLAQMDEMMTAAVFGNIGSLLCFQVGAADADVLTAQLGSSRATPADLLTLPRYVAYARLLIDGQPSRPFSMRTLPPNAKIDSYRAEIIRRTSRRRFGRPAGDIAAAIAREFEGPL